MSSSNARFCLAAALVSLLVSCASTPETCGAYAVSSAQYGSGSDTTLQFYDVGYEFPIAPPNITETIYFGGFDYDFKDDGAPRNDRGALAGAETRYYFEECFRGPWIGLGGFVEIDMPSRAFGDVSIGWVIPLGGRWTIGPELSITSNVEPGIIGGIKLGFGLWP